MVAVIRDNQDPRQAEEFLDELEFLAETADIVSVKRFTQRLPQPSARIYVGPGKLEEIAGYCREQQIDVVIFDDELSPSQTRNIEKAMPCRILDRTRLILDIFMSRAQTAYAKTQVQLANYEYMLPRLSGMWTHLERQRGGTGTAALPFEVSPHARKAGQHIFVVGQLHLRLGIGRLRPRHENIEDQARTVEDAAGHGLFDIARLRRGELVVENHHVDLLLPAVTGDLFQLARADVYAGRRLRQPLRKAFHTHDIGRFGQEFEFVEELFGLPRILVVADNGDHHGALSAIGNGLGVRGYILILSQSRTLNFKQSHRAATCGREGAPCGEQTLCYKKGILLSADTLFIKLSCRTFSTQTTYVRSVLYAEIDRERVFDTHSLVTLLAGAPFRRLVQHADGFFGKRPVGRLQHLDIGQATVLVNYKRKNDTALNPVLKGNLRELDILHHPRPERIEVSILERWHRLGSNENRVVREILVLGRRHNFDNRIRIELLEGEIRLHEPVIGNDFDQLGKSLYLDLLGFLFGRVGRDRDNIDIDGHNIHCDFLDPVLVRRIGKCDNDQGQCHDQTDLQ